MTAERMLRAESLGLRAIAETSSIRVPGVLQCADCEEEDGSFLLLEHLDLQPIARDDDAGMLELGRAIGRLHAAPPARARGQNGALFGFPIVGTIGGTVQPNAWCGDWIEFWRERRVGHMLRLARDGELNALWKRVLAHTDELRGLFSGVHVVPSLIHGDLWEGNFACCCQTDELSGEPGVVPCVFDPAAYYAHHEAEFGMSWCAGLRVPFWEGYREHVAADAGFEARRPLYELYHHLNHQVLFGGEYREDALDDLQQLLDGPGSIADAA